MVAVWLSSAPDLRTVHSDHVWRCLLTGRCVDITALSVHPHGRSYPLTWLGEWVSSSVLCWPQARPSVVGCSPHLTIRTMHHMLFPWVSCSILPGGLVPSACHIQARSPRAVGSICVVVWFFFAWSLNRRMCDKCFIANLTRVLLLYVQFYMSPPQSQCSCYCSIMACNVFTPITVYSIEIDEQQNITYSAYVIHVKGEN